MLKYIDIINYIFLKDIFAHLIVGYSLVSLKAKQLNAEFYEVLT